MKKVLSVILILLVSLNLTACKSNNNKANENSEKTNTEEKNANNKYNNKLIAGTDYIDVSRNINDVSESNFSFYINTKNKEYLTYTNKNENTKLKLETVMIKENRAFVSFTDGVKELIVSDENFTFDNEKLNIADKSLFVNEKNFKGYKYAYSKRKNYNVYCIEIKIENVTAWIYGLTTNEREESFINLARELFSSLSVNDKVGFIQDWEHNHSFSWYGASIKSSELITKLVYPGSAMKKNMVTINNYDFDCSFFNYSYEDEPVKDNITYVDTLGDRKVAYVPVEDKYDSLLYIIIFKPYVKDGIEYYTKEAIVFALHDYKNLNVDPISIVKIVKDSVVLYQE